MPTCRLLLATWLVCVGLVAASPAAGATPQDPARWHPVESRHLGATRGYRVQLPASYDPRGTERYPLLVVLDAEAHFDHVASTARFLAREGEVPELIVVGVAAGVRVHDYTQTDWPQQWIGGGGAARFKRFVADELLPAIDRAWRTDGTRLLMGHSAAGQFALHVLATEAELFQGYWLMSPSLDWDGRLPVRELAQGLDRRDRLPAFLYVAEEPSYGRALNDQLALRQVLQDRAPRGLHWQVVPYPRETHGSLVLPATLDALRATFPGHRLHPDEAPVLAELSAEGRTDALAERYALLARHGRPVRIPEAALHAVAEAHWRRGEPAAAVALLRRAVELYPASTASRDALAEGLKRQQAAEATRRP